MHGNDAREDENWKGTGDGTGEQGKQGMEC